MKIKLLVAAAATVVASSAMAQSAFQGFFGQVGVGYEAASTSFTGGTGYSISANNSNSFAGTVAIGGYFPVSGSFLLGVGAEYSPIPGSSANVTLSVPADDPSTYSGTWKKKNSYNLFVSPAIAIDKDKLAYAKVGFTGANIDSTFSGSTTTTSYTGYSLGLGYTNFELGVRVQTGWNNTRVL